MLNPATITLGLCALGAANAGVVRRDTATTSVTNIAPATNNHTFSLQAIAIAGDMSLSGMFATFHTDGPATSWIPANYLNQAPGALTFNPSTGDISTATNPPYSLTFSGNTHSVAPGSWPSGYNFMGVSEGSAGVGFSFNTTTNQLVQKSYKGKALAVCAATSYAAGEATVYSLMWRESGTVKSRRCAEVVLKAVVDY